MRWNPVPNNVSNNNLLHRQEALRRWQRKLGFRGTYRKLLEVFVQAGHTECAEALCEVLRMRCKHTAIHFM